ncbi:ABC transporter substrate-binding protein [Shinella sp. CPCC 100929]|uniref:ABC transporter substrate-binding protein n=1 Tax=Shinella lacus TaxID=2654216 RepID=A0ABT1R320_9HYPH|nr:ABC transporter substrate-binding protein [Shinella lacus]MCQ4629574.1 ABC transporter substrate-binding protein [Shinella lacus]
MKTFFFASLIGASVFSALPATAAGLTFAVVAPADGPLAILGQQVRDGARFAAEANGDTIVEIPEACDETDGDEIAKQILAADAVAAVGFLCTEGLAASLPALAEAKVPAITLSVRSGILMEDALKKNWPLFRLAPGPKAEADKAVEIITRDWKSEPFALIDDGTIHARELVEAIRLRLEEVGMKAVFVDTYRPAQEQQLTLVRRLSQTGVTHVFVGGDRTDIAVIARDAKAEKVSLALLGGEALLGADPSVPMTDGVEAIALPDYGALPEGQAVAAAMKAKDIFAEGYVLPAHAAITALATAAAKGGDLPQKLAGGSFATAIGTVAFGADHELGDNPYRLLVWRGGAFVPAGTAPESE